MISTKSTGITSGGTYEARLVSDHHTMGGGTRLWQGECGKGFRVLQETHSGNNGGLERQHAQGCQQVDTMKEEIIIQGLTVGYLIRDERRAYLGKDAPSFILDDLLDAGYAVCIG